MGINGVLALNVGDEQADESDIVHVVGGSCTATPSAIPGSHPTGAIGSPTHAIGVGDDETVGGGERVEARTACELGATT